MNGIRYISYNAEGPSEYTAWWNDTPVRQTTTGAVSQ